MCPALLSSFFPFTPNPLQQLTRCLIFPPLSPGQLRLGGHELPGKCLGEDGLPECFSVFFCCGDAGVGKSGDDGIDAIIKEDLLGLDVVNIQAKRWENPVGRPQVQAFVGSRALLILGSILAARKKI